MKICFIPIDNRPVCYSLAKDITDIDSAIDLYLPPRNLLGDLKKESKTNEILSWLEQINECDAIIIALDTIAYGGLIPSRRSTDSLDEIKSRLNILKDILQKKNAKIYAFSSIMRISNNNYNEEEKEYWKDFGEKIFEYSFSGGKNKSDIPEEIIEDYLNTRKRNFEINKLYLDWQNEGIFEKLIFSKDDCAEFGFNVEEGNELKKLGGYIKTGADEIPLSLLSCAIEKEIKVFIQFIEPDCINLISNYEDVSIEESVLGQLELGGFKIVQNKEIADIVLIVNNFIQKQGELVMGWDTAPFEGNLELPNKPYAIADVRFANGSDNNFVAELLKQIDLNLFYGYAGWNTSANTLGSLLACLKVAYKAKKFNNNAFKKLQMIRFLDDWAYQANIRAEIEKPCDISQKMNPFEKKLFEILDYKNFSKIKYTYPWNRKFEVEVEID